MKLIGLLIIVNVAVVAVYWSVTQSENKAGVLAACGLVFVFGLALVVSDRITEITVDGVGTIKAAVQQAEQDMAAIAELRKHIENQRATIDLVANEASTARGLSEDLAVKTDEADTKLKVLDESIALANSQLSDLEELADFTSTVLSAQNDDRIAFDRLKAWSNDENHPYRERAMQAWTTIRSAHSKPFFVSNFKATVAEGFDMEQLSMRHWRQLYQTCPPGSKHIVLDQINRQEHIPLIERLDFFVEVMQNDSSLTAVEYAGRYFTKCTDQKFSPVAVDAISGWWQEHRTRFIESMERGDF